MSFHGSPASTTTLTPTMLTPTMPPKLTKMLPRTRTRYVAPWPGCELVAQNPNNWTAFSHSGNRFDSIMATSGVLVRAHRSRNSARVAAAGATGALACPSDVGFDRATLRRSWPDEVDDVSLLRCLIPLPRSIRLAMIVNLFARPARAASETKEPHDHRDCRHDDRSEPNGHCTASQDSQSAP